MSLAKNVEKTSLNVIAIRQLTENDGDIVCQFVGLVPVGVGTLFEKAFVNNDPRVPCGLLPLLGQFALASGAPLVGDGLDQVLRCGQINQTLRLFRLRPFAVQIFKQDLEVENC